MGMPAAIGAIQCIDGMNAVHANLLFMSEIRTDIGHMKLTRKYR